MSQTLHSVSSATPMLRRSDSVQSFAAEIVPAPSDDGAAQNTLRLLSPRPSFCGSVASSLQAGLERPASATTTPAADFGLQSQSGAWCAAPTPVQNCITSGWQRPRQTNRLVAALLPLQRRTFAALNVVTDFLRAAACNFAAAVVALCVTVGKLFTSKDKELPVPAPVSSEKPVNLDQNGMPIAGADAEVKTYVQQKFKV